MEESNEPTIQKDHSIEELQNMRAGALSQESLSKLIEGFK
jgi:hypothetical protein